MSLSLDKVCFTSFRNYESFELDGIGKLTVFIGPNGSGKTNILEGIDLVTSASSFRHPVAEQLVYSGAEYARVEGSATGDNRLIEVAVTISQGKKEFTVNGKPKSAAALKGLTPAVSFTPDDLDLAKRSSSVRRDAIDDLGCQISQNYYVVRRDYQKTLRYKNRLLKEEASPLMIESINETLATCGAQLHFYRRELFKRIVSRVKDNYQDISPKREVFSASYTPSWEHLRKEGDPQPDLMDDLTRDQVKDELYRALEEFREEERSRARALVGPHNDKVEFFLSGRAASSFASQGQQRSIVLAWKMGEVGIISQSLQTDPILLLDDVMSELDATRRTLLVDLVHRDVQTFITATDLTYLPQDILDNAQVIDISSKDFGRRER